MRTLPDLSPTKIYRAGRIQAFRAETFYTFFKSGRHGSDAPPLVPARARCRFAPRARRAAGARHGSRYRSVVVASGRGAGRIGSERLDPGAPATPRTAIAGRPKDLPQMTRAPPSPSNCNTASRPT